MRNQLFILCSLVLLPIIGRAQALKDIIPLPRVLSLEAALPEAMQQELDKTNKERIKKTVIQDALSDVFLSSAQQQRYRWVLPTFKLMNTSHGHEALSGTNGKFNAKSDRLSAGYIDENNRIQIINKRKQICDPSLFTFTMPEQGLHMQGNQIVMDAFLPDIVAGLYPTRQQLTVTHNASGLTYCFDLLLSFADSASWHGLSKELVFMPYPAAEDTDLVLLYNHTDQQALFVHLPFVIYGNGRDGANGRRGHDGLNGTNQMTWTDKNGNTHTTRGTCGTPGSNGEDGQDGQDGGQYLIVVDSDLAARGGTERIITWINAGKGGNGGRGGIGGMHGRGSGCYGQAANGTDGHHGHNGKRGDFLYIVTDAQSLQKIFIP